MARRRSESPFLPAMEEPSSYVITLRSSPFVLALSSNAGVHYVSRLKGVHAKISRVFILHAEIQKNQQTTNDDLFGPNDKPRTRGAQRERRW